VSGEVRPMRLSGRLASARPHTLARWLAPLARWLAPLALTVALFAAAPPAGAGGLIVIPRPATGQGLSYFKLSIAPAGLARAGDVVLRNPTRGTLRIKLDPVAGETIDTLGSTYAQVGTGTRATGAARWVRLPLRRLALAPGSTMAVPVWVRSPAGTQPGDVLAGVSIEAADQRPTAASPSGLSIASVVRYVIGVEVSTPGPRRPRVVFTGAQMVRTPSASAFTLLARNAGNVILQGVQGAVRVTRGARTVLARRLGPGTFVTDSSIAYPLPAPGEHPREGARYRVRAYLRYPGGIARLDTGVEFGHNAAAIQQRYSLPHPSSGSSTAWWPFALLAAALGYGLVMTILMLRNRRRSIQSA
jgi:hypothetical protein